MKTIEIANWQEYGSYLFFAQLVDQVGKWILLESTSFKIKATGKPDAINEYCELLNSKQIPWQH